MLLTSGKTQGGRGGDGEPVCGVGESRDGTEAAWGLLERLRWFGKPPAMRSVRQRARGRAQRVAAASLPKSAAMERSHGDGEAAERRQKLRRLARLGFRGAASSAKAAAAALGLYRGYKRGAHAKIVKDSGGGGDFLPSVESGSSMTRGRRRRQVGLACQREKARVPDVSQLERKAGVCAGLPGRPAGAGRGRGEGSWAPAAWACGIGRREVG